MPVRASMIVCGASGIGKTCMIRHLAEGEFNSPTSPTVGVDFGVLRIGGLRLDVYDLSGADSFFEARIDFYRDALIILFVFDLRSTFTNAIGEVEKWFTESARYGLPPNARRFIVGTHCDDVDDDHGRRGSSASGADLIEKMTSWALTRNAIFFKVGARTGLGVPEALDLLATTAADALLH
jgi:GTPase SAR1 family protein